VSSIQKAGLSLPTVSSLKDLGDGDGGLSLRLLMRDRRDELFETDVPSLFARFCLKIKNQTRMNRESIQYRSVRPFHHHDKFAEKPSRDY
jgi:hypothetical protein